MRIGMHAVYEASFTEAIQVAARYGFDYVQFDLNSPQFYVDQLSEPEVLSLRHVAEGYGLATTFHAPGDFIGLFTDYPDIRAGMLEHFHKIISVGNLLGSHHITFHPLSPPSFRRADTRSNDWEPMHASYFEEILTENLQTLDHMSGGPLICVENHRLGSIARTVLEHLLSEKNHIALCLDIPKSMKAWNTPDPGQQQFFEAHADSVQEIHLHDLDESHSHLVPGQGGIDFGRFTELLCREIPWTTIEVRPAPLAAKGKDWLEDFRRRHKQPR